MILDPTAPAGSSWAQADFYTWSSLRAVKATGPQWVLWSRSRGHHSRETEREFSCRHWASTNMHWSHHVSVTVSTGGDCLIHLHLQVSDLIWCFTSCLTGSVYLSQSGNESSEMFNGGVDIDLPFWSIGRLYRDGAKSLPSRIHFWVRDDVSYLLWIHVSGDILPCFLFTTDGYRLCM